MSINKHLHGHIFGSEEVRAIHWQKSVDKAVLTVLRKRKIWWVSLTQYKKNLCIQLQRCLEKQRLGFKDVAMFNGVCIDCGQPSIIRPGRKRCYKCDHKRYPAVRMKIA